MKFLCLCYYDIDVFAKLSAAEAQAIGPACQPHDAALKATGKMIVQASLALPETWRYFVPKNGKPTMKQGAYTESNHQVGAFFILETQTDEDAQRAASKHATANFGAHLGFALEVRPCDIYETYDTNH